MAMQIRPHQPNDDCNVFRCGQPNLDTFFQRYGFQPIVDVLKGQRGGYPMFILMFLRIGLMAR